MPLWRRIGVWISYSAAVGFVMAGLMALTSDNQSGGNLGGILSFGFFLFGLFAAAACVVVAIILTYFHLRNVRVLGALLLVFVAVVVGQSILSP